jgi:transcriptional regulator with XRE-family HTH domain
MITAAQLRAARALIGWSQDQLAAASDVSKPTIARLELREGELGGYAGTRTKIREALEAAGVQFIPENGGGAGVRLARRDGHAQGSSAEREHKRAASRDAARAAVKEALRDSGLPADERAERKRKLTEPPKGA